MKGSGIGLGIAALIIAVIAIVIPIYGIYLGWIALGMAAFGALLGDRTLAVATVAVSAINYWFFSPMLWVVTSGVKGPEGSSGDWVAASSVPLIITLICLVAPLVAMFLHSSGKVVLGRAPTPAS